MVIPDATTESMLDRSFHNTCCRLEAVSAMAVTFLDIFNRESQYPIFSRLCDILTIGDIVNLSKTCRQYAGLYDYQIPVQWNVDKRLQRFVQDPIGLRSKMGELDVIISGKLCRSVL